MNALVIAGTHSGCGKTTVTLGILSALKKKGIDVQAFKVGPDFIDAGLHKLITGKPSRNLDLWMCGNEYVRDCLYSHSKGSDISIIEGVMGMYDGEFSTARLAQILRIPIILVIDAYGMAESVGAIVKGFATFNKEAKLVSGIILNRVSSERHFERLKRGIKDIPLLGYLPMDIKFKIPQRHLGLTIAEEVPIALENLEKLTDVVLKHINLEKLLKLSKQCSLKKKSKKQALMPEKSLKSKPYCKDVVVAIAYDKAFTFYYEDNIDLLKKEGAKIETFSPLNDRKIPYGAHALYIGGGYPELWANVLSKNKHMLNAINDWAYSGKPIYAECGGLIYLSEGIYDFNSNFFKMAAVFPFKTYMKKDKPNLGYREVFFLKDCILGKKDSDQSTFNLKKRSKVAGLRGHEFHYSEIKDNTLLLKDITYCYKVFDTKGQYLKTEGYMFKNTLVSYIHIHFGSNPATARDFLNFIKDRLWNT